MFRYIIKKNGKHGFINQEGQEVIKPIFEMVSEFNEGLAWAVIEKNGKWFSGFINEIGDWVIEPTFSGYGWSMNETSLFSEGLAPIQADNKKMMFINKLGDQVTDPIFDNAYHFSENRALVSINGLFGYIDALGNQVINCKYGVNSVFAQNSRFSQGLAAVRFSRDKNGKRSEHTFGYINKNGDVVFEPENYKANAFSEGFAMVHDGYDYYFINLDGEVPFERTSQTETSFSENLANIYDNETECFGYINTKGAWVIEPKFVSCFRFTEGLAVAKRPGMKTTGYINKTGEMVISEKFKIALPFKNGLAYVKDKKREGYINNLGEFVWKSK
ncbi:WG repeat-containing protein [Tamlana sp. 2_MG-2023]|uniref:WG repeat-containing protein n=1 Tax=unclassified Tamlana TaxID=2614803 RepID=UPI0026E4206E|nr:MULTISPECIES: WG repeat-containing protein [unclassified Tamlana]MDO6759357.1 WG repeat-containing protein [Tamlana sp. 2_MG-2023]MDO6790504.1 WG repeat-containing protein [Tamlana sp. 1_MG-2023]